MFNVVFSVNFSIESQRKNIINVFFIIILLLPITAEIKKEEFYVCILTLEEPKWMQILEIIVVVLNAINTIKIMCIFINYPFLVSFYYQISVLFKFLFCGEFLIQFWVLANLVDKFIYILHNNFNSRSIIWKVKF